MKKHLFLSIAAFLGIFMSGCAKESIGIIGGADGPTAIILSRDIGWMYLELGILAVLVVLLLIYILKKRKKK